MRRDVLGSLVLLLVVALVVLRPWEGKPAEGPASVGAVVIRVVDGDTIEARIGGAVEARIGDTIEGQVGGEVEDVRLIGVDTPETVKPDAPVQCFGPQASHFTKRVLEGRRVRLVLGAERRDVYGRLLAYVYLPQPTLRGSQPPQSRLRLFNAELIRRGLARTLTIPPNDRFAPRLRRLELAAARSGRGLWGACGP